MNSILFLFSSIYDQSAASSSAKEASSLSESRAEEQEDLPYCRSCSETAEIFQVTGNYCLLAPRSAWPQEVSLQSPAVSDARENLNGVSLLGSESVCVPSLFCGFLAFFRFSFFLGYLGLLLLLLHFSCKHEIRRVAYHPHRGPSHALPRLHVADH